LQLTPMEPTPTVHLFPGLSAELLALLRQLSPHEWTLPTVCTGWSVKDVVAHLLGGNIGRLSFGRDRLHHQRSAPAPAMNTELVTLINEQNAAWVRACERISAPLLFDFLALTDSQVAAFFATLPPEAPTSIGVGWAGEKQSATWFDIGREYTEKWFHQQHIREAVGAQGLVDRQWLHPVIEICLRALPYTYRTVQATEGTSITIQITGEAGGVWSLVRREQGWKLYAGTNQTAAVDVQFTDDTAWRLFSKNLDRAVLVQRIEIAGDVALGARIVDTVAIMA
jgi:uncharacterized protein (TIGR03083 family)